VNNPNFIGVKAISYVGTTLLGLILGSHSKIYNLGHCYMFFEPYRNRGSIEKYFKKNACKICDIKEQQCELDILKQYCKIKHINNFNKYNKFNEFLTGYYFQTFQKNVNTRLKGNRRRNKLNEKDLDASFVLRWNWFLQSFESLLDDLPVELSQLGIEMIRPQLSHFKKLLDYERRKEGKSILSDDYLTQEGLTRF